MFMLSGASHSDPRNFGMESPGFMEMMPVFISDISVFKWFTGVSCFFSEEMKRVSERVKEFAVWACYNRHFSPWYGMSALDKRIVQILYWSCTYLLCFSRRCLALADDSGRWLTSICSGALVSLPLTTNLLGLYSCWLHVPSAVIG